MIYYVNCNAAPDGDGSREKPFNTIQAAAELAQAGDTVSVAPGIYREYVDPKHCGMEDARIEYRSEVPLGAVITGAEQLKNWTKVSGSVWKASVANSLFGDYNPYTTLVRGDWFNAEKIAHTGDVYLNHKSLYEVTDPAKVYRPERSVTSWDPDFSVYTWYCSQDRTNDTTVFLANFGSFDPNKEDVEIAVRQDCFLPSAEGIGCITLSGFTVREAATQWAPPTAYQDGMIGPHWSKGWIIEDCDIYESKCCGISLGKYLQPNNDNKWLEWKYKDGTQTERDCICQASYEGWDKEHIRDHIVRRCNIHHCGQTGIVGHLGGVFSLIEDNHIHHINNKQNLEGAETGGIKMHAAIDTVIRRNHIHHCTRGLWLDWQAQGTRVTQNCFHDNCLPFPLPDSDLTAILPFALAMGEDIFVEVSHGPTLIDNNLLLSDRSLKLCAQGIAVAHNLIAGSLAAVGLGTNNGAKTLPSPRYTPYHVPHGTQVAGFMTILHGDARFYNNIFVQKTDLDPMKAMLSKLFTLTSFDVDDVWFFCGTDRYDGYPDFEEWKAQFAGYCGMGGMDTPVAFPDKYYSHLPVWLGGNHYFNGAKSAKKESGAHVDSDHEITLKLTETDDGWKLETNLYDHLPERSGEIITTETLGMAFEPEQMFENPDGSSLALDRDIAGAARGSKPTAGPFEPSVDNDSLVKRSSYTGSRPASVKVSTKQMLRFGAKSLPALLKTFGGK